MLNPDGVIYGNYRCSLLGYDLNRRWKSPDRYMQPTIYYAKRVMRFMSQERKIAFFCDLHAHSVQESVFMYGCSCNPTNSESETKNALARVVPLVVGQKNESFSYNYSEFHMDKRKEGTGRVVAFKKFKVTNAYTCEASFFGYTFASRRLDNCTEKYQRVGQELAESMLLHLPTGRARSKLEEIVRRVKQELYPKKAAEAKPPAALPVDEDYVSSIDTEGLITMLRESMEKVSAEREIDDDISSIESEQERNKEIVKSFKKSLKLKAHSKRRRKVAEEAKTPTRKLQTFKDYRAVRKESKKLMRMDERRKSVKVRNTVPYLRGQDAMRIRKTASRVRTALVSESSCGADTKTGKSRLKAVEVLFQGVQMPKRSAIRDTSHSIPLEYVSRKHDLARIAKAKLRKPLKGLCSELRYAPAYADNSPALDKLRVGTANFLAGSSDAQFPGKKPKPSLSTSLCGSSMLKPSKVLRRSNKSKIIITGNKITCSNK